MKLSAKSEYACVATLELAAAFGSNEPVRIRKIAEQHGIPARFLVQILLQLKGAGWSSARAAPRADINSPAPRKTFRSAK